MIERDHEDRGVEDRENSEILHRVDDEYTGSSVQEDTGPRLRARERVTTVSGIFGLLRVRAEVRLNICTI